MSPEGEARADAAVELGILDAAAAAQYLDELKARSAELVKRNDAALAELQRMGIGVDQGSLVMVRLAALCEALLGTEDTRGRLEFEIALQERYLAQFEGVRSQAARARLMQGVGTSVPPLASGTPNGNARRSR